MESEKEPSLYSRRINLCNFISEFSDGSALIRFELSDGADEGKVLEAVKAVLTGFSLLEENFPDFVTADV